MKRYAGRAALAVMVSALLLGGCDNAVISTTPWFAADTAPGAVLRPGWWVANRSDCAVSPDAPNTAWPRCAERVLVTSAGAGAPRPSRGQEPEAEPRELVYVLAPGAPLLVQYGFKGVDGGGDKLDAFFYLGAEPRDRDAQGRVVTLALWPVVCGPPPAGQRDTAPGEDTGPWPGLRPVPGKVCTADNIEALRGAALLSRQHGNSEDLSLRWLRDWRPGDAMGEEWLARPADQSH